jgi:hypothetical protein
MKTPIVEECKTIVNHDIKKRKFIEWLEDLYSNDPDVDEYVEMFLARIIDKAKEML